MLCVALEGPKEGCKLIILETIRLWKNSTKFWYLYFHQERYFSSQSIVDLEMMFMITNFEVELHYDELDLGR